MVASHNNEEDIYHALIPTFIMLVMIAVYLLTKKKYEDYDSYDEFNGGGFED